MIQLQAKDAKNPWKPGRDMEGVLPQSLQQNPVLLTPDCALLASRPMRDKLRCLRPPSLC